jgi:hypothetical protein
MIRAFRCVLVISLGFVFPTIVFADTMLEYRVDEGRADAARSQSVLVKDGRVMIKGAGGDANFDVLFTREQQRLFLIDHGKKSVMTLDEHQLDRLAHQAEAVQPLLQGLGAQLGKLTPGQRHKWEQMLGGNVDLDRLAESAQGPKALSVVPLGAGKNAAGIACERMNVVEGKRARAEFCLADASRLNMGGEDYATLRALLSFSERLATKARGMAGQFGVKIPAIAIGSLQGVPVEMRDLSQDRLGALTLHRVSTAALDEESMRMPSGYQEKALDLLK